MPTCPPDGSGIFPENCWGKCTEHDLITEEGRKVMIDVVTTVAAEVSEMFAVPVAVEDEPLVFQLNKGRYVKAIEEKGWEAVYACATDCTQLSGVAVDSTYCEAGVSADAVLSVTKPPVIANIGGTGSSCQSNDQGVPQWLVFEWVQSVKDLTGDASLHLARLRPLVLHELMHSLGFANSKFTNARDADGKRKMLLELKEVTDADGTKDEVWHFVKGRAYERAKDYFNCSGGAAWQGLPLMGLPEMGRASHWETRIMRDDVMSYGGRAIVSSITLAAMEDLGFYVANYSKAECMTWGYQQGCKYVSSRCGRQINDQSARPSDPVTQCRGDSNWAGNFDQYLDDKCEGGNNPCGPSLSDAGFEILNGVRVCNAQCFTGDGVRSDCSVPPEEGVEISGNTLLEGLPYQDHWGPYTFLIMWGLGALIALGLVRSLLCPPEGSIPLTVGFALFVGVVGVIAAAGGWYCLYENPELVSAWVGQPTLYIVGIFGLVLTICAVTTLLGIYARSPELLFSIFVSYSLLLIGQMAISIATAYWFHSLDDVTSDLEKTLRGDSTGVHDGKLGAEALAEIEGVVCRTYQMCCRDPKLGMYDASLVNQSTCLKAHEGSSTVAISAADPSNYEFCNFVSGARVTINPARGVCNVLDRSVSDFSLGQCQQNFCSFGVDGYFDFVVVITDYVRSYGVWIVGGFTLLVLVELAVLANLFSVRKRFKKQNSTSTSTVDPRTSKLDNRKFQV